MCAIYFHSLRSGSVLPNDKSLLYSRRGPDLKGTISTEDFYAEHHLLSMSNQFSPQPLFDGEHLLLFNGELYDLPDHGSDTLWLWEALRSDDPIRIIRSLKGEYAIVFVSLSKEKIYFCTDVFGTKPLWLTSLGDNFIVSTFRVGNSESRRVEANTIYVVDMSGVLLEKYTNFHFDLSQTSRDLPGCAEFLFSAVQKRVTRDKKCNVGLPLSAGYDSGCLALILHHIGFEFTPISLLGSENTDIVLSRLRYLELEPSLAFKSPEERSRSIEWINLNVDNYSYEIYNPSTGYNEFDVNLMTDSGALGLATVCRLAKERGNKILLSGSGADEVMGDYGFNGVAYTKHSLLKGVFPADLSSVFPWPNFFSSAMRSYLTKEEYVVGSFGMESRYPYLDVDFVQSYLNLAPEIKNGSYKVVQDFLFRKFDFPYEIEVKSGF